MKAVILAVDGAEPWCLGSIPKELAPVMNRPLIVHQLETLIDAGIREIVIVSDERLAGEIELALAKDAAAPELSYIQAPPEAGAAGRLLAAEAFLSGDPFVIHPGGTVVEHEVRASIELLLSERLHALVLRPPGAAAKPGVSPALVVAGPEILPLVRALPGELDVAQMLGALSKGGRVNTQTVTGWSCEINSAEDLLEVNRRVLDRLSTQYEGCCLHESNVHGPVTIGSRAIIEFSLICGPVAIAPAARVYDAYVGPYTCVGEAALIERVEMESCVILPGARLEDLPARLERSVIGQNAKVRRRHGLPRALQLSIGADARLSLM